MQYAKFLHRNSQNKVHKIEIAVKHHDLLKRGAFICDMCMTSLSVTIRNVCGFFVRFKGNRLASMFLEMTPDKIAQYPM